MATGPQAFYCLWQQEAIREKLFELLSKQDICAIRLANSACCNLVTRRLFLRTHLTFTANTFTRSSRTEALSRIGHHIEHLTFYLPHSNATFLPPLIHPQTGEEINFLYSPPTSTESVLKRPKYGNSELGEILTQQYPPLFHAATHVPSFINAMKQLPNMRHLTIKTPGQDPRERYRRDVVDYALISLRIALERAPLTKLSKLSLSAVHPSALNYLRHVPGFGASPSAAPRWRQIRKLYIAVESWDFYGPSPGLDHLKIMDDYIRTFAPQLEKFAFTWLGRRRGPCPIALADDPLFAPPRDTKKLFNEVTSPMSPLPPPPSRRPLRMPRLRSMSVRNATMNAPQLRELITSHKDTVREFDFENVALVGRGGTWDEALAPLTRGDNGSDAWSQRSFGASVSDSGSRPGTAAGSSSAAGGSAVASSLEDEQLPSSSPAAQAASKELFEVDLEGVVFGGVNDIKALEAGVEEWACGVKAAAMAENTPHHQAGEDDDGGLASDIEAAKQASHGFSTKLKKRRKKVRKHQQDDDDDDHPHRSETRTSDRHSGDPPRHHHHHHHHQQIRHKHPRSDDTSERHSHSRRRHRRHHSEDTPPPSEIPFMPEVIGTDDEQASPSSSPYRPTTPHPKSPKKKQPKPDISVPILNPDPLPVMLQPTVYDPSSARRPPPRSAEASPSSSAESDSHLLSSAQRSIEQDLLAEAEEAAARSSALKRAREAVMTKLTREFSKRSGGKGGHDMMGSAAQGQGRRHGDGDSAAVVAAAAMSSVLHLPTAYAYNNNNGSGSCGASASSSMAMRIREGLFGRSLADVVIPTPDCASDHRSLESQTGSALVPLIFSRS